MELSAQLLPSSVQYADLRQHRLESHLLNMVDGNLVANNTVGSSGLNCRVYQGGVWGCAVSPDMTLENAVSLGQRARSNALAMSAFGGPSRFADEACEIQRVLARKTPWSTGQKIEFLKELNALAAKKYPDLASTMLMMHQELHEKDVVTTTGSRVRTEMARGVLMIRQTLLNRDGVPVQLYTFVGGQGLIADQELTLAGMEAKMDQLYQNLRDKAEAVDPKAGLVDCIIGPHLTGVLAHEALGHPCEADHLNGGSIAESMLNQPVASELINMVDYAHSYNGELLPVPVFVDDEGVAGKDVPLVKDGILKGFMHNRETAASEGVVPTGNARSYMFEDEPLIRMRNTLILPGQSKLEDMIADLEDGYLLLEPGNGQADATTEFMFGVPLGYEVKNGKVGRAIKDTTVSGMAIEMLKTVTAVSDDLELKCFGYCGKKQRMVVSMGGPALRCKINIGGV